MARFVVNIKYDYDLEDPNMPQEVLQAMINQGSKTIDLDSDDVLANYIRENVNQEGSLNQKANLQELVDGDDIWI